MFCPNKDCPGGTMLQSCFDEYDQSIRFECEGCGTVWEEPNPRFIERENRDREEEYYNRFR